MIEKLLSLKGTKIWIVAHGAGLGEITLTEVFPDYIVGKRPETLDADGKPLHEREIVIPIAALSSISCIREPSR